MTPSASSAGPLITFSALLMLALLTAVRLPPPVAWYRSFKEANAQMEDTAQIFLGTRSGLGIRFKERDVRPMGRTATGVFGIRFTPDDAARFEDEWGGHGGEIGDEINALARAMGAMGASAEVRHDRRENLVPEILSSRL